MWVLDTNTLIYFFKGQGNVSDALLRHAPRDLGIPAIVLYELQVGIAKSTSPKKRRDQLNAMAQASQVLPFGPAEAEAAAQIRVNQERLGRPIGPYDLLIAGTAVSQNGILVTRNVREFGRIEGLRVEDWYS